MRRPAVRHAATASAFAACAIVLHLLAEGPLAAPPLGSWRAVSSWYDTVGPAAATMAGVRLLASGVALWLCLALVLQAAAAGSPGDALRRVADALTPRLLHQLVHGAAGLSLSLGVVLPAAGPPGTGPADDGTATMRPLDAPTPPEAPPPAPPAAPAIPVPVDADPPAPTESGSALEQPYHVTPGSHLWAIAEEVVAEALGQEPSEVQVRRYWLRLIEANRARLVVPANPDLLFPGQVLALPPV